MMNDAKISVYGTLTKDPSLADTEGGKLLVCNVAVQTKKKNDDGKAMANFYNVTMRSRAESCASKLQKGTRVLVVGDFYAEPRVSGNNAYTRLRIEADDIRAVANLKVDEAYITEKAEETPEEDDTI